MAFVACKLSSLRFDINGKDLLWFIFSGRNSDINLDVMDKEQSKGDDRAVLLEGGLQSASPKAFHVSATSHLLR